MNKQAVRTKETYNNFKRFINHFKVSNTSEYNFLEVGKGKFFIPDGDLQSLYVQIERVVDCSTFDYFLIEIQTPIFNFFLDVDVDGKIPDSILNDHDGELPCKFLHLITNNLLEILKDIFGHNIDLELVVAKNKQKNNFHYHFPQIRLENDLAKSIVKKLQFTLASFLVADWDNILDTSVYATNKGLRVLGCVKTKNGVKSDQGYLKIEWDNVKNADGEESFNTNWLLPLSDNHIMSCAIRTPASVTRVSQVFNKPAMPRSVTIRQTDETRAEDLLVKEKVLHLPHHGSAQFSKRHNRGYFIFINPKPFRICFISGKKHVSNNFYVKKHPDGHYYYHCHSHALECTIPKLIFRSKVPIKFDPKFLDEIMKDYQDYESSFPCKEALIGYFNHFFCYVRNPGGVYGERFGNEVILHNHGQMSAYLSATVYDPWSSTGKGTIHPFSLWNKSTSRKMKDKIVFEPYLIQPPPRDPMNPNPEEENLNMFTGMMHSYDPNFEVDMDLVDPWLKFLFNVWCKQNPILYFFILDFLSDMFLNPNEKPGLGFLIKGKQGAGKGTFINEFFSKYVVGELYSATTTTMEQLVGRFNSFNSNKLLIVGDELGEGGSIYKVADKMKSLVSDSKQSIEKKFHEPIIVNVPCRPMFLTNHPFGTIRVELNDRRYPCFETSSRFLNDRVFFKELRRNLSMEHGLHFFHYLIQRRPHWKKWQKNKIPMTPLRYSLMKHSLPASLKFIVHQLNNSWKLFGVPETMACGVFQKEVDDFYLENISKKQKPNYSVSEDHYLITFFNVNTAIDLITFRQFVSEENSTDEYNSISEIFREMQESFGIGNSFMELEETDEYLDPPEEEVTEEEEKIEFELRQKELIQIRNLQKEKEDDVDEVQNIEEEEEEEEELQGVNNNNRNQQQPTTLQEEETSEEESEGDEPEEMNRGKMVRNDDRDERNEKRKRNSDFDSDSDSELDKVEIVKKKRNVIVVSSSEEESESEEEEE